jgi:hypothetical protein
LAVFWDAETNPAEILLAVFARHMFACIYVLDQLTAVRASSELGCVVILSHTSYFEFKHPVQRTVGYNLKHSYAGFAFILSLPLIEALEAEVSVTAERTCNSIGC